MASLNELETAARKYGSACTLVSGGLLEVARQGKPGSRRISYRCGQRHMGRDEAEKLLDGSETE